MRRGTKPWSKPPVGGEDSRGARAARGADCRPCPDTIGSVGDLIRAERDGYRPKYLFFWGHQPRRDGRLGAECLSQWWPVPVRVNGRTYPTAEHYMMWGKATLFGDADIAERILAAAHPHAAKTLGAQVQGFDEQLWRARRYDIVAAGNLAKFGQHPELAAFLAGTGERLLVEASPVDRIWGIGLAGDDPRAGVPASWRGLNLLGFVLMDVRAALRGRDRPGGSRRAPGDPGTPADPVPRANRAATALPPNRGRADCASLGADGAKAAAVGRRARVRRAGGSGSCRRAASHFRFALIGWPIVEGNGDISARNTMKDVEPDRSPRESRGIGDAASTSAATGSAAGARRPGRAPTSPEGERGLAEPRRSGSLTPLARLILERILLADKVAAAKFGTGRPIDDPVREHQELDRVAELSVDMGLDPRASTEFFRDQIEANKVVQRGLHALWTDHPELRPSARPDLTGEIRPRLDALTTQILDGLRAVGGGRDATRAAPRPRTGPGTEVAGGAGSAVGGRPGRQGPLAAAGEELDQLHRDGLDVALRSIRAREVSTSSCAQPGA
jgi:hypothetical protein